MKTFKAENTNNEIIALAMRDELFSPEAISLEPGGKSLTVRLPQKRKHFRIGKNISIPAWNEDNDLDCQFDTGESII